MSGPVRFREGGGDIPNGVREALQGARAPGGPSASQRSAMFAMAAQLAAKPVTPVHPLAKIGGWKAIGLVGLVAAAGVSVIPAVRARSNAPVAASRESISHAGQSSVATPVTDTSAAVAEPAAPIARAVVVAAPVESAPVVSPLPTAVPTHATTLHPAPARTAMRAHAAAPMIESAPSAAVAVAVAACPVAIRSRVTADLEATVLAAAARTLAADPAVTLACVRDLEAHGGPVQLRDEHWFLGFTAARRLGHNGDARHWADALLRNVPDSPYAARVTHWLSTTP